VELIDISLKLLKIEEAKHSLCILISIFIEWCLEGCSWLFWCFEIKRYNVFTNSLMDTTIQDSSKRERSDYFLLIVMIVFRFHLNLKLINQHNYIIIILNILPLLVVIHCKRIQSSWVWSKSIPIFTSSTQGNYIKFSRYLEGYISTFTFAKSYFCYLKIAYGSILILSYFWVG